MKENLENDVGKSFLAKTMFTTHLIVYKPFFQSVWKILDGIGDAIDGTVEEISDFLYERLIQNGKTEVNLKTENQ